MTTCQPALQQAIYAQLASDSALDALTTGIFDEVATGTVTPYVVIGEVIEDASEAHDRSGINAWVTLHIWSKYRGYYEAALILKEVDRLLHRAGLAVPGFVHVSIAQEQHQFMRDPDPDYRHVMVRYRVWLESE